MLGHLTMNLCIEKNVINVIIDGLTGRQKLTCSVDVQGA